MKTAMLALWDEMKAVRKARLSGPDTNPTYKGAVQEATERDIRVSDLVTVEVHLSAPPIQPDLVLGKEKL